MTRRRTPSTPAPVTGPPHPGVWPPLATLLERVFAVVARLRRGRALHPVGASWEATVHPVGEGRDLPFLADHPLPGLVRLSKGGGLPAPVPDVHGLSLRLLDVDGPGRHQDLLLASAGRAVGLRHLLVPTRGVDRCGYSSLAPYRLRGRQVLLGGRLLGGRRDVPLRLDRVATAVADEGVAFELSVATLRGPWRPIAQVELTRRLSAEASRRLRFDPWHTVPGLQPAGWLNRLRGPAYRGSRRTATSE